MGSRGNRKKMTRLLKKTPIWLPRKGKPPSTDWVICIMRWQEFWDFPKASRETSVPYPE